MLISVAQMENVSSVALQFKRSGCQHNELVCIYNPAPGDRIFFLSLKK